MGFLGFFLIGCLLMALFIFMTIFICCWNEDLWYWQDNFGDTMGKELYNFNINTNKCCDIFWKNFWK